MDGLLPGLVDQRSSVECFSWGGSLTHIHPRRYTVEGKCEEIPSENKVKVKSTVSVSRVIPQLEKV
jgi:hypothetical protein